MGESIDVRALALAEQAEHLHGLAAALGYAFAPKYLELAAAFRAGDKARVLALVAEIEVARAP